MTFIEVIFKIGVTITVGVLIYWQLAFLKWVWPTQIDVKATLCKFIDKAAHKTDVIATRDPNKIYQEGKSVGNVIGKVEVKDNIVSFTRIGETSNLSRGDPFEYGRDKYKIMRVENAVRLDFFQKGDTHTDVLVNVECMKVQ